MRLRRRHPEVQVIELADNVGYGGGLNAGAAVASGDVLVFSNSSHGSYVADTNQDEP